MSTKVQPEASTETPDPRAQRQTSITVMIGRAELTDQAIWWPVAGVPYDIEAAYDPAQISLADAETALRRNLAEHGMQVTRFLSEDARLSTAQRTLVADDGLGGWLTEPVETALRDIDGGCSPTENEKLPFLAARVAVLGYRSQAYGRRTEVWLDYGRTTGPLTPAKAREVLEAMRTFVDQFEAVVDLADDNAVCDFEGDPEIAAADREAEDRRIRAIDAARIDGHVDQILDALREPKPEATA